MRKHYNLLVAGSNVDPQTGCTRYSLACLPSLLSESTVQLAITLRNSSYTECPRRNVPDFGRVLLMLKYSDITQNTYVQS